MGMSQVTLFSTGLTNHNKYRQTIDSVTLLAKLKMYLNILDFLTSKEEGE
jgi:hypothetical protein